MLRHIERLRTEPKHVRNRYAFWIAFTLTLCIALIWSVAVPLQLVQSDEEVQKKDEVQSSFFHTLGSFGVQLKQAVFNLKPTVEYQQELSAEEEAKKNSLDLDAMFASSTEARKEKERTATVTPEMVE